MKKSVWTAVALVACISLPGPVISGCQEVDGPCWPVAEDGQAGAGGGPIIPAGVGGYGETEPQNAPDEDEPFECDVATGKHRCKEPGSNACVDTCERLGAYCPNYARHPFSPSSGDGALFFCRSFKGSRWECAFRYSNGDNCWRQYPEATWKCLYTSKD